MFKHKYTKAQNLKYLLSYPASLMQLFYPTSKRENGISVMIRVKDEEEWIAKSLLSLNEFADEVVVVNNNSTDNTLTEIESIRSRLNYKLIVEDESSDNICVVSNHALSLTSYRWIFRWDSDFIAHTLGEKNIRNLRSFLLKLNPKKHYLIYPITFSFAGDLFHVKTGSETNSEGYIHTWHSKLKYMKKGKYESLQVPFFYKIERLKKIFFIHIGSAKPLKKILHRFFWLYWQFHLKDFSEIDQFIEYEAKQKWNGLKPEEIAVKEFQRLILPIRKFNTSEFGSYPEIMQNDVKESKLKVTYKDGKPFSRNDFKGNTN
ncbi:MAG: glycosyltransferase family 2 protein [Candidatus Cloacimonetes bacterium]|jgi:glycosyltransferase involved in cell wall biosynthesis|nr:glycosyltransferase family 2 protein [Candidatus Cloacimonadota bacterium]MBT4332544.1 glycosyltransferase family 2 protein [Candidatus Cloacimonadota bacterium]MBT5420460.1 glycosyltransferase family 2 protein [Candidatus Cloacimonadota bacterium]